MKIKRIIRRIDAVYPESPYTFPPPMFVMVAMNRYTGLSLVEVFNKSPYFKSAIDDYKKFLALSKDEKTAFCSLCQTQLEYCVKLLKRLDKEEGEIS